MLRGFHKGRVLRERGLYMDGSGLSNFQRLS